MPGERLDRRAIQIGLTGDAVHRYCDQWIRSITDITAEVRRAAQLVRAGQIADAGGDLPAEQVYPLSQDLAQRIEAEPADMTPESAADGAR